jgi:hypothetical protein
VNLRAAWARFSLGARYSPTPEAPRRRELPACSRISPAVPPCRERRPHPPRREGRRLSAARGHGRSAATRVSRGAARCQQPRGSARQVAGGNPRRRRESPEAATGFRRLGSLTHAIVGQDEVLSTRGSPGPPFVPHEVHSARPELQLHRGQLHPAGGLKLPPGRQRTTLHAGRRFDRLDTHAKFDTTQYVQGRCVAT